MAVKLRLARAGAKKAPYYRVVATDSRSPRDGRFIEQLGIYDPTRTPVEVRLDHERIQYWLQNGATASDTVSELITRDKAKDKAPKGHKAA
jgi:small subunit ribosomal protein S16